jgi:hypothetical protein
VQRRVDDHTAEIEDDAANGLHRRGTVASRARSEAKPSEVQRASGARSEAKPSEDRTGGLLTPELLANIGKTAPPNREVVTRRDIRKYAIASGQTQRRYLDGDVAPPLFHVALFWPVVPRAELTPDGVAGDELLPKFPLERAMAGGLDIEYLAELRPGDAVVATRTLTAIYEKAGRSGPLIFYEIVMEVRRESGELLITEKTTRILR